MQIWWWDKNGSLKNNYKLVRTGPPAPRTGNPNSGGYVTGTAECMTWAFTRYIRRLMTQLNGVNIWYSTAVLSGTAVLHHLQEEMNWNTNNPRIFVSFEMNDFFHALIKPS